MVLPSSPPEDVPVLRWLDARGPGVDPRELRDWAREISDAAGAAHSSRSYSYPYALIAVHGAPVGVDVERIGPYDAAFAKSICTPSEDPEPAAGVSREHYLTSLWASKEALAKALGDAVAYDPRRLESPVSWSEGRAGRWRARELLVGRQRVAWLCWRAPDRSEHRQPG
jgi:hypothetical protein